MATKTMNAEEFNQFLLEELRWHARMSQALNERLEDLKKRIAQFESHSEFQCEPLLIDEHETHLGV